MLSVCGVASSLSEEDTMQLAQLGPAWLAGGGLPASDHSKSPYFASFSLKVSSQNLDNLHLDLVQMHEQDQTMVKVIMGLM